MTTVTRLKLGLAIMGLVVFAWGIRVEQSRLRAIGIAFVAVSWALRFVKTRTQEEQRAGTSSDPES
jgi:hypothetical protein